MTSKINFTSELNCIQMQQAAVSLIPHMDEQADVPGDEI